jgi:hypothetical protein
VPGHHADVAVDGPGDNHLRLAGPELALNGNQMYLDLGHGAAPPLLDDVRVGGVC